MNKPQTITAFDQKKCVACGYSGISPLHKHHVRGRRISDEVVYLCPNCHGEEHQSILLVDNLASRRILQIWQELEKKRFVSTHEKLIMLERSEYKPVFDGEPDQETIVSGNQERSEKNVR